MLLAVKYSARPAAYFTVACCFRSYLIWNLHEQEPGEFYFDGHLNFPRFFQLALKHDLLVILRVGPFIAAEVDMVRLTLLVSQERGGGQQISVHSKARPNYRYRRLVQMTSLDGDH